MALLFSVVLIAVALVGCGGVEIPEPYEVNAIGQGQQTFRFVVVDDEENATAWDVSTNENTVGASLLEVGLIVGDVSAWGLLVTAVNGLTADFDADGAWWAFYINGEMAMQGVDATYIQDGDTYAFVFTAG